MSHDKTVRGPYTDPTHEVLYDLTQEFWSWHAQQGMDVRTQIMDLLVGSRGVFEFLFAEAVKFQQYWDGLPEDDPNRDNYYDQIAEWFRLSVQGVLRGEKA